MKANQKETEISTMIKNLNLTREEAEQLWEFDHKTDKEQKEILDDLGIKEEPKEKKKSSPINKVKQLKKKKQIDETKEEIKTSFIKWAENNSLLVNIQEIKNNQFVFQDKEGNFYSFKLTKHKSQPDGYKV